MVLSSLVSPLTIQGDTLGSPVILTLPTLGRTLALRYVCGRAAGVITGPGKFSRAEWTPPLELAAEYPDRETVPVRLILEVYEKGEIADSRESQVLLSLPAEIQPSVQLRVFPETGEAFLQGDGRAVAEVTAAGTQGAEIARCILRCGGLTGQGKRIVFDLPQAGEIAVIARVTDSRGRTAEASTVIRVLPGSVGSHAPLLDLDTENRAIGLGCRGDRAETVCLGLDVHMEGKRLRGLPQAEEPGDALPLSQTADFLKMRKLWENPAPEAAFSTQTIEISGGMLLIEAAAKAGEADRVWEIVGAAGTIRVLSGSTAASRSVTQTEAGLHFGTATPEDSWAIPLTVYALKEGETA